MQFWPGNRCTVWIQSRLHFIINEKSRTSLYTSPRNSVMLFLYFDTQERRKIGKHENNIGRLAGSAVHPATEHMKDARLVPAIDESGESACQGDCIVLQHQVSYSLSSACCAFRWRGAIHGVQQGCVAGRSIPDGVTAGSCKQTASCWLAIDTPTLSHTTSNQCKPFC